MSQSDFRLEYVPFEERLVRQLRRWKPPSGYGEVTLRVEWQADQIVRLVKLTGEESWKL